MRELRYIFALLVALLVTGCSQTIVFEEDDVIPTPTPTPPVEETIQNNEIWYTSTNGAVVTPYADDVFNSTITSNTYSNGKGVIKFSSALTRIGDYAFYNCRNLATVTLPDGIREIESGSFSCCSNLTEFNSKYASSDKRCLIINNQLVAFAPSGVTEYDISEGVAAIGNAVFADCKNITAVTISDDVTSIGFDAFKNCSKLLNVYCKPTTPPTLTDASAFAGNATDRMIYVWGASLAAYRSAQRWSDYADAIHGYDFNTGRFDEIPSELHIVGAYQNSDINAPHSTLVQVDDSRLAGFFYVPSQEKNGFKLYEINAAGNLNKVYSKVNGKISVSSTGDDITLGAGLHYLVFDYYNMVLTDTSITRLGIIGDAVGNWDSDCGVFVYDDENSCWSVTIDNVEADKEYKIRCNNGWDIVLGGTASDIKVGTDVSSIKTTQSGTVKFTLNLFDSPYTVTEEKVESSLETISVAFTTVALAKFPEEHGLSDIYWIIVSNEAGDSGELLFYDNTTPFVALSGEYQTVVGTLGNEFKTPCLLADPGYCCFTIGEKTYYPVSGSVTVTTAMPDMDTNGFDFNLVVEDESKRQYALKGALDNNIVGAFGYVGTSYTDMDLAAWGFTTFEATSDASNTNLVRLTSTNANGNFVIELTTSDGDITNGVYSVSDGTLSGYYFDGLDAKEYVFQDGQIMFEKVNGSEKKYKLLVSSRAGDWLIGDKYKVVVPSNGYYSITINSLNSTTGYVVPENAKRHTIEIDITLGSYTNIASQVNIAHLVQGATAQEVKMAYLDSNNRLAWQNWSITDGWFGVYGACSWGETECVACIKPNVDGSFEYVCAYPEREAGTTATAILDYGNNIIVAITVVLVKPTTIPNNEIWYTSVGDNVLNLKNTNAFGSEFVSHRFENGKGIITCAGDITEIGYEAFSGCDKMLTITIPNSVTAIGNNAFYQCSSLPAITLPKNLTSIGRWAFSNCKALTKVEIPQSVTTINDYAFQGCTSLTEVTIPQSVTTFGSGIFNDCASMKTFNGKYATSDHLALVVDGVLNSFALGSGDIEYTIPTGVTEISSSVFSNSTILGKLTIPAAVTKVGVAAFYNCDKLTELVVEDSSTSLMERAFSDCDGLEKVTVGKENLRSMMASVTKQAQQFATAVIAPALPISKEAFAECGKLKEVTIGEGVTAIGDGAFDKCYSLVTVNCKPTTPPTLDSYSYAFRDNADSRKIYVHALSLNAYKTADGWKDYADAIVADPNTEVSPNQQIFYTSTDGNIVTPLNAVCDATLVSNTYIDGQGVMIFNKEVTKIGHAAFNGCETLDSITIPQSVKTIGESAFSYSSLASISMSEGVTNIGVQAFYTTNLTTVTIPNSVIRIEEGAFCNSMKINEVTLSNNLQYIGDFAFCYTEISTITIPESVTEIDGNPFSSCESLVTINGKFATADNDALIYDDALVVVAKDVTRFTIPETIKTLEAGAFDSCKELTTITIPTNVTEIGCGCFGSCDKLTAVYCQSTTPPIAKFSDSGDWGCFHGVPVKIFVPAEAVDAYKTADGWSAYADVIEAEPELELCQILYTSTDGNVVTLNTETIGGVPIVSNTYENGQGVITCSYAVPKIGGSVFKDCTTLESIVLPDGVTSIGYAAFSGCTGLKAITIPKGLTTCDNNVFIDCSNLSSVYIEDLSAWCKIVFTAGSSNPLRYGGATLYLNGTAITELTIPADITEILRFTFIGCGSLTSVTIPDGVTAVGDYVFEYCTNLTSATISNSVTTIGAYMFYGCTSLSQFTIGENITTINTRAFYGCSALASITIPESVTTIEDRAFYDCAALESVYCKPLTPPTIGSVVFNKNHTTRKIYVPANSVDAYISATNWSAYADAICSDEVDLSQYTDLSTEGTANCYLVKGTGNYKLKAVKGNSTTSVGDAYKATVLWETFGTATTPNIGDLVRNVGYKDGYVYFSTPTNFANGNASIAVLDTSGTILWSWHIWCSAEGWMDDVYTNNAGTLMDRNLGATSATPDSVGALGLMYQWGRKDPFLGSSSISASSLAKSTGKWTTNSSQQTVEYACQNPTTFICGNEWCTGDGSRDSNYDLRWKDTEKTAYDPCPVGYRVPKGGDNGFWATVSYAERDSANLGLSWILADGTTAWYPHAGFRSRSSGELDYVGSISDYWSASPGTSYTDTASVLHYSNGLTGYSSNGNRSLGSSVRCFREGSDSGSSTPDPEIPATPGNRTIMTVADLQNFIAAVNAGDYSAWKSRDGEVKLGADLDLAGADLTPIESFDGVFNGQNFALKNWKTTRGLFDKNTGVVKNVIIDATCTLTVAYDSTGDKQSGFVAENNQPTGVVSGCVNHGFVKSTDVSCAGHRIGGVVGVSYGIVNDCINYGEVNITSEAVNSSLSIGGVVGFINTNASTKDALGADFLVNCINRGKVTVLFPSLPKKVFVGGVLGATQNAASTTAAYLGQIKNCVNHGEVSYRFETLAAGTYANVGGVVGYAQANMENCDNYGEVSYTTPTDPSAAGTRAAAGGVVGCNIFGITNCNNYGELFVEGVWASGTSDAAAAGSQVGSSFGGVVGCVGVYNTYKADYPTVGCNNYGKVDLNVACKTAGGTAGYFAGVLGYSTNDVEDCHNYGEVNIWTYLANTYLAGVVGYTTASVDNLTNNNVVNLEVEGVTTTGKILYPAGVVGRAKAIKNCVNNGETNVVVNPCEIAISTIYGGGVAGYVDTKIENSTLNAPFSLTTADNQASLRCAGVVGQVKTGTAPIYTAINCNTTEKATITLNTKNTKANYIGGIMGFCSNGLDNCTNKASIDVTFAEPNTGTSIVYVAGVSGNQKETMNNCHNEGNISVDMGESTCPLYAATLVGMNHTSACVVKDCTNSGNLEIVNYAGESQVVGIFGGNNPKTETDGVVTEEVTFENCTNTGIVTVNGTRVE